MEELRQAFLADSISRLEDLQTRINTESFSAEVQRGLFRALHTIKGTAQTFNLFAIAKTAHELEDLLQARRDGYSEKEVNSLLREGLQILAKLLQNNSPVSTADFSAKIKKIFPQTDGGGNSSINLSEYISAAEEKQLSAPEKNLLAAAIENGARFFIIEALFHFTDFAAKLPKLREKLNEAGEIIATFPGANTTEKIAFQLFFASRNSLREIAAQLESFDVEIIEKTKVSFSGDLHGILKQTEIAAQKTAKLLDKKVDLEINANKIEISGGHLKLLSDALLHLVRNAVDHGIEREGKIKIEISSDSGTVSLKVSDDGRGIDLENVRHKAVEKNLIAAGEKLSEAEVLNLIFAHGFSTAGAVSEISGRGVGLDAVKDSIEKAGGEIRVKSAAGKGTTFEIFLQEK